MITENNLYKAIVLSAWLCSLAACGGSNDSSDAANNPTAPTVTFNLVSTTLNRTVTLIATATAATTTTTISNVEFLVDNTVIGSATTEPFTLQWDTSTVSDGAHNIKARATDSANVQATSASTAITVANNLAINTTLSAQELFPQPNTTATGTGTLSFNLATGTITGNITLSNITATAVEIGNAYAGNTATASISLTPNGSDPNQWDFPVNDPLTNSEIDDLLKGKIYVVVKSAAYPAGELRNQLLPDHIEVRFNPLQGVQEVPTITTSASGIIATTINTATSTASVVAYITNGNTTTAVNLYEAAFDANGSGTALLTLTQDTNDPNLWTIDEATLSINDLANYNNELWYANVLTATHPTGELRGQIFAPVTLSTLQANIFGPICSVCHTGVGGSLPGVMNLSSKANTYAAIVNATSLEQGGLKRILPNDPTSSYLVLKVQGDPSISNARMPLGGALSQAQIDDIRIWVLQGARNN